MERIIEGNLLIEANDLPDYIGSITTTKYSNILDFSDKEININTDFLEKYFSIKDVVRCIQIHSNRIRIIDNLSNEHCECDGLITSNNNIALGILTADCFVVQLYGKKYIANLHCGWKGIYSGIIENAFGYFNNLGDLLVGAIVGPGICKKCYIVGKDFINKFNERYGNHNFFNVINGEYYFSLRSVIEYILKKNGVNNIKHINYCSCCSDYLYSYRGDNKTHKRVLSLIWKKL